MSDDGISGHWDGEPHLVEIELRPCPFCHYRPIAYCIPPHTHGLSKLPPFAGSFYIECPGCSVGMCDEEMLDLQRRWNDRPYDLSLACSVPVMKEPKP